MTETVRDLLTQRQKEITLKFAADKISEMDAIGAIMIENLDVAYRLGLAGIPLDASLAEAAARLRESEYGEGFDFSQLEPPET